MTKFLVALIIIIGAGGLFLYTQQAAQAPAGTGNQNPFGEGSNVVGPLDGTNPGTETPTGTPPDTTGGSTGGQTGGGTTPGVITRAELAKHNTQADCWVAYKGVVYDVTGWLPRHPGSAGAIAPFCGTAEEFAAAFNKKHGTTKEGRLQQEGVKEGTLGN